MIWKARKNAAVKKEVIENTDALDKVKTIAKGLLIFVDDAYP